MQEQIIQKYICAHYQLSVMKSRIESFFIQFEIRVNQWGSCEDITFFSGRDLANLPCAINLGTICHPCVNL